MRKIKRDEVDKRCTVGEHVTNVMRDGGVVESAEHRSYVYGTSAGGSKALSDRSGCKRGVYEHAIGHTNKCANW